MQCPSCKNEFQPTGKQIASELGKRGKGQSKARTSEQARAAANARWKKVNLQPTQQ